MTTCLGRHARSVLTLCLLAGVAREAAAQRVDERSAGARFAVAPASAIAHDASPAVARAPATATSASPLRLAALTLGGAVGLANTGALLGMVVDRAACERRHRNDPVDAFYFLDPCALYYDRGTSVGWLGGAVVGSTIVSAVVAQRRGCPARVAGWRAVGGALLGATPGTVAVLGAHHRFPPGRSAFIVTGPLLTGAGATLAVVGCHR
jgi:hypothetical protein